VKSDDRVRLACLSSVDTIDTVDAAGDPTAAWERPEPPAPKEWVNVEVIDTEPRALWEKLAGIAIVVACTAAVFAILNAEMDWSPIDIWPLWRPWDFRWEGFDGITWGMLFDNTTTNGGDMGAHVWWPKFLEENWFGKGRLSGWAPDWYAGFPAGHYYFPLPAVFIAAIDTLTPIPYTVAFKWVTVMGPLLLPASAYYFARGIRAPWPAPPAFAIAALGMLVQTRSGWQIYGGNIASTLAGEFSFTIALAFGLFGLGALGKTLDTGRKPWLPCVLIAAAAMSHIVVAFFVALVAVMLWLSRKPWRTFRIAIPVGLTAIALTSVWSVPLLLRHNYTQSMRYTKLNSAGSFELWGWLSAILPSFIEDPIVGIARGVGSVPTADSAGHQYLWLPWWTWVLAGVAVIGAAWYRRRSTLVLFVVAIATGIFFVQWPEHAVWNARWLPFWVLTWGFVAAMGATELMRLAALGAREVFAWIRAGDLHDARAVEWIRLARDEFGDVAPALRSEAVEVVATRQFERIPPGYEPPVGVQDRWIVSRVDLLARIALVVIIAVAGIFGVRRAYDARDDNPSVSIEGWARWNYSGYERKPIDGPEHPISDEYFSIMNTMGGLEEADGSPACGRALWEPSAGEDDPINTYGTSLALELLPYFTDGCIGSMEGLYFESSGTTSYHFLTVSKITNRPSNPVRGLVYGTLEDFDEGVESMRQLGVRYYMAWTDEAQAKANANPDLELVADIPDVDTYEPTGWKVYELKDHALVEGLRYEPVVAATQAGTYSECWDQEWGDPNSNEPQLGDWECDAARWWKDGDLLDQPWAGNGPDEWERIDIDDLADAPKQRLDRVEVTDVVENPDKISFTVDQIGVPVVVRASYFPNWNAHGAEGPYRLAPNMMVVIPTEKDVSLTYDLTPVDWFGRFLTLLGIVGLVLLIRWKTIRRYSADYEGEPADDTAPVADADTDTDADADDEDDPADDGDGGDEPVPPDRPEPAPALP